MLNCDLGESFGAWSMPVDDQVMVYIDQANIACGFHAGDPVVMQKAIGYALAHNVSIGAHPSYPDLQGFGRRSMQMPEAELMACLHYQIAALDGMAAIQGSRVEYVKPHGALYNDLMQDSKLRQTVLKALASYSKPTLPLMIQAHPNYEQLRSEAAEFGIILLFEAFADRRYQDNGFLVSRQQAGAVLTEAEALAQAEGFMVSQQVVTENQLTLSMPIDSICVHGDSPGAIAMVKALRVALTKRKLTHVPIGDDA
jgi:UPF0271 protein